MQSFSECLAIAVCVHVCAFTGDGSSCLLELHTVLDVQPVTMLTSVSCTTSGVQFIMDCIGGTCHLLCDYTLLVWLLRSLLRPSCSYSSPRNMHTSIGIRESIIVIVNELYLL